jgi:hypothetical protein
MSRVWNFEPGYKTSTSELQVPRHENAILHFTTSYQGTTQPRYENSFPGIKLPSQELNFLPRYETSFPGMKLPSQV